MYKTTQFGGQQHTVEGVEGASYNNSVVGLREGPGHSLKGFLPNSAVLTSCFRHPAPALTERTEEEPVERGAPPPAARGLGEGPGERPRGGVRDEDCSE